jgi:ABC-2 type transport system ATP-binding protein
VTLPAGALGSRTLIEAVRRLDAAGVEPDGLALRRPSLDDVFLALTGHAAEEDTDTRSTSTEPTRRGRRSRPVSTGTEN